MDIASGFAFRKPMFVDGVERDAHLKYILELDSGPETFEHFATEHLRMSATYWALMSIKILEELPRMPLEKLVEFVVSCEHDSGGFGGNVGHDPHLLYTLSAIQILALVGRLDRINRQRTAAYIANLQQADGAFIGDEWGEVDTRFSYCAMSALTILGQRHLIEWDGAAEFIYRCQNLDGGFGSVPGAESHAGQIFCCLGALSIAGKLDDRVDVDSLGWWLCERQLPCGGLNGRPEKKEDVCYSWWVLSSLAILDRVDWIDTDALSGFIKKCQDPKKGGIADRPGDMTDIFHTFFGLAALSILHRQSDQDYVDPVYALPASIVDRFAHGEHYRAAH